MKIGIIAPLLGLTVVAAIYLAVTTPFEFADYQVLAFTRGAKLTAAVAALAFIVSSLVDNVSQIDKVWSVIPAVYAWIFVSSMPANPRVLFVACLISFWSLRLTFNACRRGFYVWPPWQGEEDYRWKQVRATTFKNRKCLFVLFNFFFISIYQMCLIFLFTCPVILCHTDAPLSRLDMLAGAFLVTLVVLEFIADGQQ